MNLNATQTEELSQSFGELLLFPWKIGLAAVTFSLLVALLVASVGVLISLRAATVRQAQQTFSLAFLVLFIPLFLLLFLPESWRLRVMQAFSQVNVDGIVLGVTFLLLALDLGLLLAASRRFQRTGLILDD